MLLYECKGYFKLRFGWIFGVTALLSDNSAPVE